MDETDGQDGSSGTRAGNKKGDRQRANTSQRTKLTAAQKVVLFFALLGFLGSVGVYFTVDAPIITSFFLATGVASLVYQFLGGVGGTTLVWGGFRMGGALAALVGVALVVNDHLEPNVALTAPGQYEWQWGGDSWAGYVRVNKDGTATIGMDQFVTCDGKGQWRQVLHDSGRGKAEPRDKGRHLSLNIPVQFIKYDGCREKGLAAEVILNGTLDRALGYRGKVIYQSAWSTPQGDMNLLHY